METIGLVGAGVMGRTVTPKIFSAGYEVLAFDPSTQAMSVIESLGATAAASPAEIAERASITLMFLPAPPQVISCVAGPGGLLSTARAGTVLVDMSTVDPNTSEQMWKAAEQRGVGYLDAPVLGRPSTIGNWALPVGGTAADIERCKPLFQLFAKHVMHIGGPGSGNKIKLLNQLMFSAINAMTGEMMAIASKVGIEPQLLYETITASQAGTVSNLFRELGSKIVADNYDDPTFSVDLLCKDVRLAIEMAKQYNAPPLLASTTQFANEMAQAQGLGRQDTAVMWKSFQSMWQKNLKA